MDTKSEDGDPRDEDSTPLTEDERALLDRLRASDGSASGPYPADTPRPAARPSAPPDGLDPVFREPTS